MNQPKMPLFYFGRLGNNTDKYWIMTRMLVIPESKQQEVADEYSRIYQTEKAMARKKANAYLESVAKEYRNQ